MKKLWRNSGLCLMLLIHFGLYGQHSFLIEFLPGAAGTFPMPLNVYQNGTKVIAMRAHYKVEPFVSPIYYSYRFGFYSDGKGWEVEMNHLKIYLENTNDIITRFSVSHGYNQLWVNRAWERSWGIFRVGVGPVISHDENTVNGLSIDERGGLFNNGYHIKGISTQVAIQKRLWLNRNLFISFEGKANCAYAGIKVVNGHARTPLIAWHLLTGLGFAFKK